MCINMTKVVTLFTSTLSSVGTVIQDSVSVFSFLLKERNKLSEPIDIQLWLIAKLNL